MPAQSSKQQYFAKLRLKEEQKQAKRQAKENTKKSAKAARDPSRNGALNSTSVAASKPSPYVGQRAPPVPGMGYPAFGSNPGSYVHGGHPMAAGAHTHSPWGQAPAQQSPHGLVPKHWQGMPSPSPFPTAHPGAKGNMNYFQQAQSGNAQDGVQSTVPAPPPASSPPDAAEMQPAASDPGSVLRSLAVLEPSSPASALSAAIAVLNAEVADSDAKRDALVKRGLAHKILRVLALPDLAENVRADCMAGLANVITSDEAALITLEDKSQALPNCVFQLARVNEESPALEAAAAIVANLAAQPGGSTAMISCGAAVQLSAMLADSNAPDGAVAHGLRAAAAFLIDPASRTVLPTDDLPLLISAVCDVVCRLDSIVSEDPASASLAASALCGVCAEPNGAKEAIDDGASDALCRLLDMPHLDDEGIMDALGAVTNMTTVPDGISELLSSGVLRALFALFLKNADNAAIQERALIATAIICDQDGDLSLTTETLAQLISKLAAANLGHTGDSANVVAALTAVGDSCSFSRDVAMIVAEQFQHILSDGIRQGVDDIVRSAASVITRCSLTCKETALLLASSSCGSACASALSRKSPGIIPAMAAMCRCDSAAARLLLAPGMLDGLLEASRSAECDPGLVGVLGRFVDAVLPEDCIQRVADSDPHPAAAKQECTAVLGTVAAVTNEDDASTAIQHVSEAGNARDSESSAQVAKAAADLKCGNLPSMHPLQLARVCSMLLLAAADSMPLALISLVELLRWFVDSGYGSVIEPLLTEQQNSIQEPEGHTSDDTSNHGVSHSSSEALPVRSQRSLQDTDGNLVDQGGDMNARDDQQSAQEQRKQVASAVLSAALQAIDSGDDRVLDAVEQLLIPEMITLGYVSTQDE